MLEDAKEMIGMFFAFVFDGEIVDGKAELGWMASVFPEAGCIASRVITMLVGKDASLW